MDLTKGSVPKVLLHFSFPFLVANLLQALYGGADLFVVGQYGSAASVAAVAIGSQVMHAVTGIILGLATGVTVMVGVAVGARDGRKAASIVGTAVSLFAVIAVVLTAIMVASHTFIARAMQTPSEALAGTEAYLWICSSGIPFIMGYNVVCGILRGQGDSRTPLYFVALACVLNIALDFLLVGGCGMQASGAAIATVLSQGFSFVSALVYLRRKGFRFAFTRRDLRPVRALCRRMLMLGAPIALQDVLISFSFLLITVIVNQMGVVASAALGVVEKLITFAMLPPLAISSAVAAMTAQNYGAGQFGRMRRCLRAGIGMALVFGVSVCLYAQFLPDTLTGIFTNDVAVIQMASGYLRSYSIDCVIVSFVFCINAYFSGQGNSVFPMVHSVISAFLFRIPLSYLFGLLTPGSLLLMGFASPLATFVSLVICIIYMKWRDRGRDFPHPGA